MKHMLNQPGFYVGVICLLISYGIDQTGRIWITEESEGAASPGALLEAFVEYADVLPSQKPKSTCAILQIPRENNQTPLQLKFCPPPQMSEDEKKKAEDEKEEQESLRKNITIASVTFTVIGIISLSWAFWGARNDHQAEQHKPPAAKNEHPPSADVRTSRLSSGSSGRDSETFIAQGSKRSDESLPEVVGVNPGTPNTSHSLNR